MGFTSPPSSPSLNYARTASQKRPSGEFFFDANDPIPPSSVHGPCLNLSEEHVRLEPSWNTRQHFDAANSAYDALHADFHHSSSASFRSISRFLLITGTFIAGAAVGIATVCWMIESVPLSFDATAATSMSPSKYVISQTWESKHANDVRGISAGELPYDGVPPEPPNQMQVGDSANANIPLNALHSIPEGIIESGAVMVESSARTVSSALPPSSAQEDSVAMEFAKVHADVPRKTIKQTNSIENKPVAKKKRPSAKLKDREIERIRQQASEELKRAATGASL